MESKHFKVGALVDIITPKSHLPNRNVTLLEVHDQGVVGRQEAIDNSPVCFYSWDKIEHMQLTQEVKVVGIRRTAGGASNASARTRR